MTADVFRFRAGALATFAVILAAAVVPSVAAQAAPTIQISTDKTRIYRNEPLNIQIVISGDYDEFRGPSLDGFTVAARSEGHSFSLGFGGSTSSRSVNLTVFAEGAGKKTIGAARLLEDGRVVASSRPIEIEVVDSDAPADKPVLPGSKIFRQRSLFPDVKPLRGFSNRQPALEARLTPTTANNNASSENGTVVYPGQPLLLEYMLRTPLPIENWNVSVPGKPDMEGFIVKEQPRTDEGSREVNGDDGTWYETVLWRAAIIPINAGELNIDPMVVAMVFRDFEQMNVRSEGLSITVSEIPPKADQTGFAPGVLGRFVMDAKLQEQKIRQGESTTLTVTITGTGNLMALRSPEIESEDGLRTDAFAPSQDQDDIQVDEGGISGSRTFKYLLTAESLPGGPDGSGFKVKVPALVFFNYFSHQWAEAEPIELELAVEGVAPDIRHEERRTAPLGIVDESTLKTVDAPPESWFTPARLALIMIIPVLLLVVVETVFRVRRHRESNSGRIAARSALKRARTELHRLEKSNQPEAEFWTSVEAIIRHFLEARFGMNSAAMTPLQITAGLGRSGVERDVAQNLLDHLETCSLARFAMAAPVTVERTAEIERLRKCLASLDQCAGGVR